MQIFRRAFAPLMMIVAISLGSANSPSAWGQGGGSGNVGNGGSGGEPEFRLLRDLIIQWIELGALNIDIRQSPKPVNWSEILEGLRTIHFQFDPTGKPRTVGNSKDRACTNYTAEMPGGQRIECHLGLWNETPEADKLAVVAHEYMGAMGYEPNQGDFSEYWFSSQLLGKLLGNSPQLLTEITEDSFDASLVRPAPTEVLMFIKSLMSKNAQFRYSPRGTFHFITKPSAYRESELVGQYLKNGDYFIRGIVSKDFGGQLGTDRFSIRRAKCLTVKVELVFSPGLGIRSITTETRCSEGDFQRGYQNATIEFDKDGTVKMNNNVVPLRKFTSPIEIKGNGTVYENRYVHPWFRQTEKK